MSEFKPCPFCGSVNLRIAGGPVYVECNDCAAYGPSAGYENKVTLLEMRAKAIALWEKASEKTDRANAELASLRGELAKVTQQRDAAETRSENIARQAICLEAQRDTLRAELEAVRRRIAEAPTAVVLSGGLSGVHLSEPRCDPHGGAYLAGAQAANLLEGHRVALVLIDGEKA